MEASYTIPKKLFEGEKQFFIPLFQRQYSWKTKQWRDLWQDLLALHELIQTQPERKHFIGSVVMHPTNSVPVGVSKYAVIDGQQRLTTLFVLLVALRDVARHLGHHTLAERLTETYLINKYAAPHERLKVQPTQDDRPALRYLATPAPAVAAPAGALSEAYTFFHEKLLAWVKHQPARADEMFMLVLERLSLVSITLNNDDDPYLVFESLNAKGMKLTAADLIRNYLFMRLHPEQQDELNAQYWLPMQGALGDSLTEFIRHYLMRDGGNVAQSDVYGAFRKATEKRDVVPVLQEMARFAPSYARLLHPDRETERPAVQRGLRRLHQTRLTVAYPLILRLYDQIRQGTVAESTLLAVLDALENFALRSFITKRGTGGANKSMQALATRTLGMDADANALLAEICSYLATQNYPTDDEVRGKLLTEALYHAAGERNVRTRLLLETLELALNPKEVVAAATLSIEHVLPQKLTPEWRADLGAEADSIHATLLHTVGNLTLTGWNSELSNRAFAVKKAEFAKSNLALNATFAQVPVWNAAAIQARSAALAEQFLQRYPALAPSTKADLSTRTPGVKPTAVWLHEESWPVKKWVDVALITLRACAAATSDDFYTRLNSQRPHYVSANAEALRSPKALSDTWFYEGHQSAIFHKQQCRWALAQAGIPEAAWRVETVEPGA